MEKFFSKINSLARSSTKELNFYKNLKFEQNKNFQNKNFQNQNFEKKKLNNQIFILTVDNIFGLVSFSCSLFSHFINQNVNK